MSSSSHPMTRLWHYTQQHRGKVWLAMASSIINKLFDLAPPLLIGAAVDVVVQQQDSFLAPFGLSDVSTQLWFLAAMTAIIWVMESVTDYTTSLLWRNLAQTVQHEMRLNAYGHVQELEMAYYEDRSTGGLMAVLNDDVNQLERFLDFGARNIIQLFVTIVVIGGSFFVIAPSVAWMAVLPMPLIVWGSIRYQRLLLPRYAVVRERVGLLSGQLANNLGGIATVKSFTAEQHEIDRIDGLSNDYRVANQAAIRLSAAFVPLIRMFIMGGFIAIMVYGGKLALDGSLNIGLYSIMVFMTQRLLWPLTRLGETLDQYQRAMASTNRVMDLLDRESRINSGATTMPTAEVKGNLVFDHVGFQYHSAKNQMVIRDFSVEIPAGSISAFVGATGAGKSTLIKLLLRFYDVQSGKITLDGHDIRDLRLPDLRRAVGLVSQDVFLFHGTVRENIAYGTFGAALDQVVEAAKIAEAHAFITHLPDGYDTVVGERGVKLSGGQRQRVSLARAILKNPPILILDEATSSVDNETEAAIQRSLEKIAVGRTTIVIAHRLSTVRNADRILVMEHGQLKEAGRHDDLVGRPSGIYSGLWRVQTGELDSIGNGQITGSP